MLRITDMLLTETPRPCLDDPVFTDFATLYGDTPVVIDGTDPYALFVLMTMASERGEENEARDRLVDAFGENTGWQIHEFFHFDWQGVMGCVAPPYDNFVIEMDNREGMTRAAETIFGEYATHLKNDLLHIGKTAVAFTAMDRETWNGAIMGHLNPDLKYRGFYGTHLRELAKLDFRWIYIATTWRYEVGRGLRGPSSTYFIPVGHDGNLMYDAKQTGEEFPPVPLMMSMGPICEDESRGPIPVSEQYALSQGWTVLVPALFSLSLLHTPRTTKKAEGYHDLVEGEMPKSKVQRRFLEKNFRPMTTWRTLDITPLREAIKRENGGSYPTSISDLRQALHTVRGHTATYMPNTYFGKKHDQPITVFRPSYVRGDAKAGVIQKEYTITND